MTLRPSSSGTSSPGRRREASTVKAPLIGRFSSRWIGWGWVGGWRPQGCLGQSLHGSPSHLRWSHDGKFFARMTLDTLSIYETPVSGHFRYLGRAGPAQGLSQDPGAVELCVLVWSCSARPCCAQRVGAERWLGNVTVSGFVPLCALARSHRNLWLPFCKNVMCLRRWPFSHCDPPLLQSMGLLDKKSLKISGIK